MTIRRATKAGSWYPGEENSLRQEVERCLNVAADQYPDAASLFPGPPVAVMVPHAGLTFSGPLAAAAFQVLRTGYDRVDRLVVFGACHRERLARPAVWADGAWETPLGDITVDAGAAADLIAAGPADANQSAHEDDNAIELQTPFIKYLFPEAKMVPVAMGFFRDSFAIGERMAKAARHWDGVTLAVASTDLTHYGAAFGVTPAGFGEPALKWARENDAQFLEAATRMAGDEIVRIASRDGSACGAGAVAAAIGWAKEFGATSGQVIGYTNSHDVMPDGRAEHFVGYAAVGW
ncbi:MAG: AmmeMemoRadiSam system protein B [Planctomycetaceae bacterium]|nr:AmmeMemoRadiSam system protein B [Planctomycetaceae bacterium]